MQFDEINFERIFGNTGPDETLRGAVVFILRDQYKQPCQVAVKRFPLAYGILVRFRNSQHTLSEPMAKGILEMLNVWYPGCDLQCQLIKGVWAIKPVFPAPAKPKG